MSKPWRLVTVLILNFSLVGALVIVGRTAHSIGVMAAGADYFADGFGIGIALIAYPFSRRHPQVHSVAALINGGWILVLSVMVAVIATLRLIHGTPSVHGLPVLLMSSIAMIFMVTAALFLRVDLDEGFDDVHENLSTRAVLLDTMADAVMAGGVAATGTAILIAHGLNWLDPAVAIVIAVVIAFHSLRLLIEVRHALRRQAVTEQSPP